MNRMIRGSVAAVLAASVALGAATAPAVAGPRASHVKAEHKDAKAAKAGKAKATKADRGKAGKQRAKERKQARLAKAERRLTRHATRKHAYLVRLLDAHKLERLEDTVEAAVRSNIEGDIAELAELIEGIKPAAGEEATTPVDVRAYRPEVYHVVINQLRMAGGMTDRAASTEQASALMDLVTTLCGFDAETKRTELRASKRMLISIKTAVEAEEADEAEEAESGTGGTETETEETETDIEETGADGTP